MVKYNEGVGYSYTIYNADHEIVRKKYINGTYYSPHITYMDENTIQIETFAGTNTYFCTYYDILNDRFSEQYETPLATEFGKVVIYDRTSKPLHLIVQDIFDDTIIYGNFELADMADAIFPVTYAEFIDEDTLSITYKTGEDYEERTDILSLKK